jgi:hypothetical protein
MSEVFVSYGHPDDSRGWVRQFSADLSNHLEALTREPPQIFSDHQINPLEPWRKVIEEAAETARVLVVISSPNFLTSKWCERECEVYWRRVSRESAAQSRIAVVELLPISDREIEHILEQGHGIGEFIDPRELWQILKQFTPMVFYKKNSFGVPMPLALGLGEAGARNTSDFEPYAERVYTLAYRIKETVDKLRRRDEEERVSEDDDDVTLDDIEGANGAAAKPESIFVDCGPSSNSNTHDELLSLLRGNPSVRFSFDFDTRDYESMRAERFAEDGILVTLYKPGEDDWLRDTLEVVYRALKLRKELGQRPPRKLLIAGEVTPETRTKVFRQLKSLIVFVDLEMVSLDRAKTILAACAGPGASGS